MWPELSKVHDEKEPTSLFFLSLAVKSDVFIAINPLNNLKF